MSLLGHTLRLDSREETKLAPGDKVTYNKREKSLSMHKTDGQRILFVGRDGHQDNKLCLSPGELIWFLDGLCTGANIWLYDEERSEEKLTWIVRS